MMTAMLIMTGVGNVVSVAQLIVMIKAARKR